MVGFLFAYVIICWIGGTSLALIDHLDGESYSTAWFIFLMPYFWPIILFIVSMGGFK